MYCVLLGDRMTKKMLFTDVYHASTMGGFYSNRVACSAAVYTHDKLNRKLNCHVDVPGLLLPCLS